MTFFLPSLIFAAMSAKRSIYIQWDAELKRFTALRDDCFICARRKETQDFRNVPCPVCDKAICRECFEAITPQDIGEIGTKATCPFCRGADFNPWEPKSLE